MRFIRSLSLFLVAAYGLPVLAHPEHHELGHSAFTAGWLHPFSGLDHLLMAVGFGLLCYRGIRHGGGKGTAILVAALLGGFVIARWIALPISVIEGGILLSVFAVAGLIVLGKRVALMLGIGVLALFHGMAHAIEIPSGAAAPLFAMGMVSGMLALFALGLGVGALLKRAAPQSIWAERLLAGIAVVALFAS